jgi:hypothetical protein
MNLGGGRILREHRWREIQQLRLSLQVLAVLREGYPPRDADEILAAFTRTGKKNNSGDDNDPAEAYPFYEQLCGTNFVYAFIKCVPILLLLFSALFKKDPDNELFKQIVGGALSIIRTNVKRRLKKAAGAAEGNKEEKQTDKKTGNKKKK